MMPWVGAVGGNSCEARGRFTKVQCRVWGLFPNAKEGRAVRDRCCVVDAVWSMMCGRCCVVDAVWSMLCG
jgi:hypothetical protein